MWNHLSFSFNCKRFKMRVKIIQLQDNLFRVNDENKIPFKIKFKKLFK